MFKNRRFTKDCRLCTECNGCTPKYIPKVYTRIIRYKGVTYTPEGCKYIKRQCHCLWANLNRVYNPIDAEDIM